MIMSDWAPQNYEEAVEYIEELPKFTKKHSLQHTRYFLEKLGNPGYDRKIIHVAGTNGKGSVCAYMQAVLGAEEKKVGFFTSPHLIKINERIQLNRSPVDDDTFYRVFFKTLGIVRMMQEEGFEHPSYFEFLFGMGMMVFGESDVEYIILETGLGGRLDATNAPENPLLTVITSVSLDHTEILGDTIDKIAYEKAGIIKENVPVFFDGSSREAAKVIRRIASERRAPCREITNHAYEIQEVSRNCIAFSRKNAYDKDITWYVPICGIYQVMNAEIVLQAIEYVLRDIEIDWVKWMKAVFSVRWEGRMERIAPHLTVDGAHNLGALEAFVQSLYKLPKGDRELPVFIFSAVSDKKYEQMISYLCREIKAKAYIVTEIDDKRKVPVSKLSELFGKYTTAPVYERNRIEEVIQTAYEVRGDSEIYCLGSLYLVGAVKKYLAGGSSDVRFCGRIEEVPAKSGGRGY